jgi:hypothetical protein
MTAEIASKAQIPNPALKPFHSLVGEWRTTGTHPLVADTTLFGRALFAWHDGGAFLVWRSHLDDPRFPDGIAIFGSDDETESVFISYFDERGVSRMYDITVDSDGFTMQRINRKFSQRMTFKIEAEADRMTCKGEMSREGGAWESDLSLVYERLK